MQKNRKMLANIVLLVMMLSSFAVFVIAQPAATDEASAKAAVEAYINKLTLLAQWFAVPMLIVAIIGVGFMKMSPNPESQERAKKWAIAAGTGFIIIEFAVVLAQLIKP